MSWLDRVNTGMIITCGDGKSYTPNWLNARKIIDFNIATFEFKELAGTLVERGEVKGTKYPVEIYFQGEDHLDTAKEFEISARDKRAWTIKHPYYDTLVIQPVGYEIDNGIENISKITSMWIETLGGNPNTISVSAPDKIKEDKGAADAALGNSYSKDLPSPSTDDKISIQANLNAIYNNTYTLIVDSTDLSNFYNLYAGASALLNNTVFNTLEAITAVQSLINAPIVFVDTLENRIAMFQIQLGLLNDAINDLFTFGDKKLYENNAGTIIGAMIAAAVTNIGLAYANRTGVLNIIEIILNSYNSYVTNLDQMQSANGGNVGSYIPDANAINNLSQLTSYSVNALLAIANDSKKEFSVLLEEDSNVILLANQYYGLKDDDSTIDYFINTNNILQDEIFEIKKGRRILYYA